jgi:hypothetical protein
MPYSQLLDLRGKKLSRENALAYFGAAMTKKMLKALTPFGNINFFFVTKAGLEKAKVFVPCKLFLAYLM